MKNSLITKYIKDQEKHQQNHLNLIYQTISEEILSNLKKRGITDEMVVEKISWKMPTFVLNKNLIHFAAHKNHVGLYPSPSGVDYFKTLSSDYSTTKGAIQFPYSKELPVKLIKKIVDFKITENLNM